MEPREVDPREHIVGLFNSWLKPAVAVIGSALASWWNAAPQALRAALVGAISLVAADIVLGSLRAICERKFRSSTLGRSIVKVCVYCISLLAAYGVDSALGLNAGAQLAIALMVCLREASSVVENSAALGFPWPAWITARIQLACKAVDEGPSTDKPIATMETTGGDDEG